MESNHTWESREKASKINTFAPPHSAHVKVLQEVLAGGNETLPEKVCRWVGKE